MSKEKPNTYTAEFRAPAVKLANESGIPISQVADYLGIKVNALHAWVNKYSCPKENNKALRAHEHLYEELKRLKKQVARLVEERDLLKKAAATLPMNNDEVRLDQTACRGICGRCHVPIYERIPKRLLWLAEAWSLGGPTRRCSPSEIIQTAFGKYRATYGTRRLKAALSVENRTVSRARILQLMHEAGLVCKIKRKFKATTNSTHNQPVATNRLDRQFTVAKPNQVYSVISLYSNTGRLAVSGRGNRLYFRQVVRWSITQKA